MILCALAHSDNREVICPTGALIVGLHDHSLAIRRTDYG